MRPGSSTLRTRAARKVVQFVAGRPEVARELLHSLGTPTLFELWNQAGSWHTSPADLLERLFPDDAGIRLEVLDRGRSLTARLLASTTQNRYPEFFMVENGTAAFLYAAVRLARPEVVVETGVGDGLSTALVLAALDDNEAGVLHSLDLTDDVGSLVADRTRWHLHIGQPNDPQATAKMIAQLAPFDIFLHDGDHRYHHQSAEYREAWEGLRRGGLLISDDVDASYAFHDRMVADPSLDAALMIDVRKVSAAARRR